MVLNIFTLRCITLICTVIWHKASCEGYSMREPLAQFQLLARVSVPQRILDPINIPYTGDFSGFTEERFHLYKDYYTFLNQMILERHNEHERQEMYNDVRKKLFAFIDFHIRDLKRLLVLVDKILIYMTMIKLYKKQDVSEMKIQKYPTAIPYGVYSSPEYKCLGTSYYVVSAHSQEDAQMLLASERKPHCYNFRASFQFGGYFHRHGETNYIGPHKEPFPSNREVKGLYCDSSDLNGDNQMQCIYKILPREEFPESVEYEPKVSYFCGPYRYFIPATTDIRCIFSVFSMSFILRLGYAGVVYKHSDLSFTYQNGQVFYTDEPWAGMSCWNWACKWRHNQAYQFNEHFTA